MTDEQLHNLYGRQWNYENDEPPKKTNFTKETCMTAMELMASKRDEDILVKLAEILVFLTSAEKTEQLMKEQLGSMATYEVIDAFLAEKGLDWRRRPQLTENDEKKLEKAEDDEARKRGCPSGDWMIEKVWD